MNSRRRLVSVCVLATASLGLMACREDISTSNGQGGEAQAEGGAGMGGASDGGGGGDAGMGGEAGGMGGGGAGGEGGQGGSFVSTGADACPGEGYALANGDVLLLDGDTSTAADDFDPLCDDGTGADRVYDVTISEAGTLDLAVFSADGAIDPVLTVRTACSEGDATIFCRNTSAVSRSYRLSVAPGTYSIIVDSAAGSAGKYQLSLSVDAPACGDGAVNAGEECDDGNIAAADGCDASCHAEAGVDYDCDNAVAADAFLAAPLALNGNTFGAGMVNDYDHISDPNCADVEGGGPEHVYAITAQSNGDLHLRVGFNPDYPLPADSDCDLDDLGVRCWIRTMYVRTACADANSQIACFGPGGDADGPGGVPDYAEEIVLPGVVAGEVYYVFIDSYWDGQTGFSCGDNCVSGPYTLHVSYD
jgi:cysteine-rich repeat protein